jgi:hypothetical protein
LIFQTKNIKFICKSEIKDEKAVYDKLEKSIISLFFLTNENSEDLASFFVLLLTLRSFPQCKIKYSF